MEKNQKGKNQKLSLNKRTIVLLNEKSMGRLAGGTGDTTAGDIDDAGGIPSGMPGQGCIQPTPKSKKTINDVETCP